MKALLIWYRDTYRGVSRAVWILALVLLVNRAGTMVLPFLTLFLTQSRGLNEDQAALMLLAFGFGSVSGSYLGGQLTARFGAIRVITLTLLGAGLGFIGFLFLEGFAVLAAGCFVISLLADAFRPAIMTAVAESTTDENRTRSFTMLRLAGTLGMGIGPAVGGHLAEADYNLIFLVDGLTCIFAALAFMVMVHFFFDHAPTSKSAKDAAASAAELGRAPFRDGPFMAFMVLVTLFFVIIFQFFSTLPLYLKTDLMFSERDIGYIFSISSLVILLFEMPLVHTIERFNHIRLFGVGAFLFSLGLAMMVIDGSFLWISVCTIVFTSGEMLSLPFSNTIAAARAGNRTGEYMGVYAASASVGLLLGPPIGLWIQKRVTPVAFWIGVGLVGVIIWVAAVYLAKHWNGKEQPSAAAAEPLPAEASCH
ncbi:MDR family MFS transporter [Acanthopleuribacter pedis]|uniref:MFS transporter n=1 Tax=Acanthopleuribacter pedis TaxID=442870 RepID=A0A8J7U8W6_9BACT|nr:MFS transporter [Acanthopleuribacter pedis]MBO1323016.1 MFS transporter [Acanthopleuribacter pedis]